MRRVGADSWRANLGELIELNNQPIKLPIEITTEFVDNILFLLKEAHDLMDDLNARHQDNRFFPWCNFCHCQSYDSTGLIHEDDCILVKIRHVIHT